MTRLSLRIKSRRSIERSTGMVDRRGPQWASAVTKSWQEALCRDLPQAINTELFA